MAQKILHTITKLTQNGLKATTDVVKLTFKQVDQAHLLMAASSLAYTTILSLVPALAISFAVFKAFGGLEKLYQNIAPLIISNLTEGSSEEVILTIRHFIENAHAEVFGIGGFVGILFTSMSMLWSIEKAINQVWQVNPRQKLFQRLAGYWLFITLGPLGLAVAAGVATSSDVALSHFLPSGTGMYLMGTALFFLLYKWVPNVKVETPSALASAAITAALWNLARFGYVQYTQHVVTYNKIYGSLGAVPILLIWIYIVWVIVLGGAALTAALQKRVQGTLS